jgi:hypothetical protein
MDYVQVLQLLNAHAAVASVLYFAHQLFAGTPVHGSAVPGWCGIGINCTFVGNG